METTFRFTNEIRQSSDGSKTVAVINSGALDRHGTIIDPDGVDLGNYSRNPVFLINHDYDLLAGNGANIRKQDGKLIAEVPDEAWDVADPEIKKWFDKVKAGFMRMTSIGFMYDWNDVEEQERIMPDGTTAKVPVIRKSELLEFSFVTVGSNPDAMVLSRNANKESIEIIKELKAMVNDLSAKLDRTATNDYVRAVVEEHFEKLTPQSLHVEAPVKEQPVQTADERAAQIEQIAQQTITQFKRQTGRA
jgi:predicted DNA-binding protein